VVEKRSWSLPYLALILNAMVWGLSWWPLRELQAEGLHPLWSSSVTYLLGGVLLWCVVPKVLCEFLQYKPLWLLALAAGFTMVGFNWGVSIGEVIRVVLLFYLMPIWSVLLARWVLNESISLKAILRIGLALVGAVLVLSPEGELDFPWPSNLAEWLGLMGGAAFALNNVLLRHQSQQTAQVRLFAMFVGGMVVPVLVATFLALFLGEGNHFVGWPVVPGGDSLLLLLGFTLILLAANYGLQYGASRLPANVTSVVMLSEVVFATLSAILLNDEVLTLQVGLGGMLILLAAVLSALDGSIHVDQQTA
jgi:drug/metabolite transporter (DMT)-like permease